MKRSKARKKLSIAAGVILAAIGFIYLILPFALDRMDGTVQPSGALPFSLYPDGKPPLSTQFMRLDDGMIAYDDTGGTGPLVICIPGMGDLRQEYRFLAPQLAEAGFRIVTMDLRGHGESSVDWPEYTASSVGADILSLIHHLNAGPAVIIGTSMAAGSSVWAAVEESELVAAQILIGPFVRAASGSFVDDLMIRIGMVPRWGVPAWSMFYKSLYPSTEPSDLALYRGVLKENLREPGRFNALRSMMWRPSEDIEARLDLVKVPSLVIMGTLDPDFQSPEAEASWLTGQLDGEMLMVEGAGHYPHAEMPELVGPEVIAFLKRL